MREIKFRGKDYNNKWRYGDLVQEKWGQGKAIMIKKDKTAWSVLEATVGQYTGLKDRNMKEIYEGDIVKRSLRDKENNKIFFEDFYVIIFEKATFQYKGIREYHINKTGEKRWKKKKETYRQDLGSNFGVDIKDIEVIGNIYDNKNLLEEGE